MHILSRLFTEIDLNGSLAHNPVALHCRRIAPKEKSLVGYVPRMMIAWLVLATSSSARDIFVDNVGGSDLADGSSDRTACRTIERALRSAEKGDRIVVANTGQPYRESITLQAGRHSGTADRPFTIVGNGAILEGAAPVPEHAWEHAHGNVFRFSPRLKSYQLLFLDGRPANRVKVARSDRDLPELKPREWCLFERQVYFCVEEGRMPQHYDLSYSALAVGITMYEVRNVIISDLVVQGFQLDGVNAHDGVNGATLRGVTCRGNARSGISVGGASRIRIEGCLVGNNGAAQVRTEGQSHTHIADSSLLDNTAPPLVREGGKVYMGDADDAQDPQAALAPRRPDRPKTISFVRQALAKRSAY